MKKLKHMPATPMTQKEMQDQCDIVSEAEMGDPGEDGEEMCMREHRRNITPEFYCWPD